MILGLAESRPPRPRPILWTEVINTRLTLFVHPLLTMTLDEIPLFAMLKSRLGYLSQRQHVISENVANSDTPGYTPRDLQPFTISTPTGGTSAAGGALAMTPVRTDAGHLAGFADASGSSGASAASTAWKVQAAPDSEGRLDGNRVVLEEQMMKLNDAKSNYDAAISFYEKSMGLIELAIRAPGKGA